MISGSETPPARASLPTTRSYGRIRLTEQQAYDLRDILGRERTRLLTARAEMRDYEVSAAVSQYNRLVARLERMQEELDRMTDEMGWETPTLESD